MMMDNGQGFDFAAAFGGGLLGDTPGSQKQAQKSGAQEKDKPPAGMLTPAAVGLTLKMVIAAIQRDSGAKYLEGAIREGKPGVAQLVAEIQGSIGMANGMDLLLSVAGTAEGREAIERAAAAWPKAEDGNKEGGANG